MKRFHVHVAVENLEQSLRFYSTLFGTAPAVLEHDYAKWLLDDPRLNFAISTRAFGRGIDHVGLQVDSAEELAALERRLRSSDASMITECGTTCCYAKSDKHWVTDPQGVAWETFHTLGAAKEYGVRVARFVDPDPETCFVEVDADGAVPASPASTAAAAPTVPAARACCP